MNLAIENSIIRFARQNINEFNKIPYLCMNLSKNKCSVNRLKIFLNSNDTYTMYFYRQIIDKNFNVKISNEKRYEGIYFDMLQDIFTEVTGLYTHL